ncbi:PGN_0703 family putative restriction endonuclease [Mycolicibacterium sp. J2]|uniref:PGN_0703 family putative restriction endonuclease n=1 Tax=Mycolicibacterium sp. J2 TaxID=2993511 RepID=UPI00224B5C82|nr:hypothetical protein [Mycolicibacterium sp. J2]MCX2714124.1 hypothetical protein [Mycolicibacterium sp. J2]
MRQLKSQLGLLTGKYPGSLEMLAAIGPQLSGESGLARRVRFHQSWYRAVILGRSGFGATASAVRRPLGSILTDDDARAGLNFTSPAASRLFRDRHAEGWGLDPLRCIKYLTSSQTLTLNMFGLFAEAPEWFARVLRDVLQRPNISSIKWMKIEYAPLRRSRYLGDSTRVDVLVLLATRTGDELLVIEIKYSDRFNSRTVNIDRPTYRQLASAHVLWADVDTVLQTSAVNQLARCHALAMAVSDDLAPNRNRPPSVVVLHHEFDQRALDIVKKYQALQHDPSLIQALSLRAFVSALVTHARSSEQRFAARALELRYISEVESQEAWETFLNEER